MSFNSPINIEHKIRLTYSFIKNTSIRILSIENLSKKSSIEITLAFSKILTHCSSTYSTYYVQGHYKKIDIFMFNQSSWRFLIMHEKISKKACLKKS